MYTVRQAECENHYLAYTMRRETWILKRCSVFYRCLQDRQRTVDFVSNWSIKVEIPAVSEDCLYLNIYTPAKPAENTKLPVSLIADTHRL